MQLAILDELCKIIARSVCIHIAYVSGLKPSIPKDRLTIRKHLASLPRV